ncbi:MAG: hypothetical protein K9M82_10855 [Deltaproteobacteria bacterium]|nr:hypothetical protein [Deltaproteobacteria bacterium]
MSHHLWMIIACVVPLLLIFFLPLIGAGSGDILFLFLVLCFGVHLLMMGRHRNGGDGDDGGDSSG